MYPEADFFTLFVDPKFVPEALRGRKITTSFLDRIPGAKRIHRHLLPLYPLAVECLDLSGYDLVISADGAATKGVLTDQHAVHLCYCHSPSRAYWDQYAAKRRSMKWFPRTVFAPVSQYLRQWDFAAAQRIDGFIANSAYVADRVRKYYRRESVVVYPPVETGGAWIAAERGDYYAAAGRLVASKRTELMIEACNRLGRRLRIAGTGPEEGVLRSMAGPTIEFLGRVGESALRDLYAACRALLFAADEDFGLVAVEAQAFGRPVIAYGHGGSLETVRGVAVEEIGELRSGDLSFTGVFFAEQTAAAVEQAILSFESIERRFDPREIQAHARRFDTRIFVAEMGKYVDAQIVSRRRRIQEASAGRRGGAEQFSLLPRG